MKTMFRCLSFIAFGLLIISCKPDKTDDPTFTPSTADNRDKYTGLWNCTEYSKQLQATTTYTINITKSGTSSSEILIDHFYDLNATARASINNSSSIITIPYQQLGSLGFAAGSGTLSTATQLNMTYTTNISNNKDTCTASCVKQ